MSDNLRIYNAVRAVPSEAQRLIQAGRLKGKTDINPMWRIKALTEQFGPCGDGWGYSVDRLWIEDGAKGEKCANVMISLWYRLPDGSKSDPIIGIGGNMLVTSEKNGMYTSDECYKMALTDAISVACKALGIGADVYWSADSTKYTRSDPQPHCTPSTSGDVSHPRCTVCGNLISPVQDKNGLHTADEIAAETQRITGKVMCDTCYREWWSEHGNR